jgi:hypothetical protein
MGVASRWRTTIECEFESNLSKCLRNRLSVALEKDVRCVIRVDPPSTNFVEGSFTSERSTFSEEGPNESRLSGLAVSLLRFVRRAEPLPRAASELDRCFLSNESSKVYKLILILREKT